MTINSFKFRAEHNQQFPGVLNRSPSDMEEAIYNGSNSEVSVCITYGWVSDWEYIYTYSIA